MALPGSDMNNINAIYDKARQHKVPLIRIRVPKQELLTGPAAATCRLYICLHEL